MPLQLDGTVITRIAVVDDSEDARNSLADELRDAAFEAFAPDGPFDSLASLTTKVRETCQAAVFDHHLRTRAFAPCTGAEAVDDLYRHRFPAVLVTGWSEADIDQIRRHRKYLPVLLKPEEATLDRIGDGIRICFQEFNNTFTATRRPWRTLVRIEDVDRLQTIPIVYAIIPAWNSKKAVRFPLDVIASKALYNEVKAGARFFARVNIGAEDQADLFFDDFEFRG